MLALLVIASIMIMTPMILYGGNDISEFPNCPLCGMSRDKFAHSRMLVRYQDGSSFASCSLHCTALELAYHPGKVPVEIKVGDYNTQDLLTAENATWVMGGRKKGVMTTNAKWAFGHKDAAQAFVGQHGGRLVDFETAMAAAYADMYADTLMIRKKRQKKAHHQ
jgi:hypothetical protein